MNTTVIEPSCKDQTLPEANCKNPTPDLSTMNINDRHRYDALIQYLQTLISLLEEMNLTGQALRATLITSLARSHKSRFQGQSYRASDLVQRLQEFDSLVVSGYEIKASTHPDLSTSRSIGYIEFKHSPEYTNSGKTKDNDFIYFKKWTPTKVDQDFERRRSERFLDKIEQKQREEFEKLRESRKFTDGSSGQEQQPDPIENVYLEDPELHDYLCSLMQKSRASNLKDKSNSKMLVTEKSI